MDLKESVWSLSRTAAAGCGTFFYYPKEWLVKINGTNYKVLKY